MTSIDRRDAIWMFKISEPSLVETLRTSKSQISFTSEKKELSQCDLLFISSDVPTDDKGRSSLEKIRKLIKDVVSVISDSAILVILCQVPPGFTREIDFERTRLFYQVETLIFGCAMERVLRPERFMSGADEGNTEIPGTYKYFLERYKCPIIKMRYESAELAKISINFSWYLVLLLQIFLLKYVSVSVLIGVR